jgi:serine/threonine protein kinase
VSGLSDDVIERLRGVVADSTFTARFDVEREIGSGGMGRVFCAFERTHGRRVAIKFLDPKQHGDPVRFAAEAEIVEGLDHPAIVPYVAHGVTSDGAPYLAMAWLEGETLAARLARGRLEVASAVAVGRRVADALAHLHARDIVHRDIKPSNVMLVANDPAQAIVIDLGIAKDLAAPESLTQTGQMIGTPGYMAPEQMMGEKIDERADLFSLGCLLYQAISGAPPFSGTAAMEILARVLLEDPAPLEERRPGIPDRLAALVHALLNKRADERTLTADQVGRELDAIADALARADHDALATTPLPVPRRSSRPSGLAITVSADGRARIAVGARPSAPTLGLKPRRRLVIALSAACALVIGAIAVLVVGRPSSHDRSPPTLTTVSPAQPVPPIAPATTPNPTPSTQPAAAPTPASSPESVITPAPTPKPTATEVPHAKHDSRADSNVHRKGAPLPKSSTVKHADTAGTTTTKHATGSAAAPVESAAPCDPFTRPGGCP